jgi:phosphotransferase system enzyme I (PtsP)
MVETPSAVWSFRRLIEQADFAAIGTNDLVQYMLAVDRSNANVAALNRPEDPVMLQVLKGLVETARAVSKPLSLCGEIAADHYLLPLLLGLGIRDFSVSIPGLPSVRRTLASLQTAACEAMAEQCFRARSVLHVRQALDEWHEQACPWERHVRATAIDPVCNMVVDPGSAPYSLEHDGKRYFFCQRRCMEVFRQQVINN